MPLEDPPVTVHPGRVDLRPTDVDGQGVDHATVLESDLAVLAATEPLAHQVAYPLARTGHRATEP